MADIKTHLRELSVAVTVGLAKQNKHFTLEQLYDLSFFYKAARNLISNDISIASNILNENYCFDEFKEIISNGYNLGQKILTSKSFSIPNSPKIVWLGYDTQKGDPIDLQIEEYDFSLKENSYILKNMGLYDLLNNLTHSHYKRGLHIFNTFAKNEYNQWFHYTFSYLVRYLQNNDNTWSKDDIQSRITLSGTQLLFSFQDEKLYIPLLTDNIDVFTKKTTSKIREKVFAKWINEVISNDDEYQKLKKKCSLSAGRAISNLINENYSPENISKFLQLYDKEYYYAKTTEKSVLILKVPRKNDFNKTIIFDGCNYSVPNSQLNIITQFHNHQTNEKLIFRNECRFSHGQFNGTPEAKLYIDKNTSLSNLYAPIE